MSRNAFQEGLLHHLSRDRGEADWSVVPWIFLFALLEYRSDIYFLPALGNLPSSPCPLKENHEWPQSDVTQLPHHPWVHPFRSLLKVVPISVCSTEGIYSLLSSFPLVSEACNPWRLLFHLLHHQDAHPIWLWVHVFLSFPVSTDISVEASLIALQTSCHIWLHVGFGFPYPFTACLDNISIFLLNYLSLLSSHSASQWPELFLGI